MIEAVITTTRQILIFFATIKATSNLYIHIKINLFLFLFPFHTLRYLKTPETYTLKILLNKLIYYLSDCKGTMKIPNYQIIYVKEN